jgi:hypothetical protein
LQEKYKSQEVFAFVQNFAPIICDSQQGIEAPPIVQDRV